MTVTHDTPFIKNSVSQPTPEVKQEISTVNSTQLVLENPDAYDEIQSRFNELLQQKGDLEKNTPCGSTEAPGRSANVGV